MIKENKVSKYMLYDIGEIVLVVIGILIALQLNNWNSDRKLEKNNIVLMQKLIDEIEMNMERVEFLDLFASEMGYQGMVVKVDSALNFLYQGLDTAKVIWMLENQLFMANNFNMHTSVYEEMISTGRLYSLGRDTLTKQIDKYYKRIEREEYYNQANNKSARTLWSECKYGWGNLKIDYQRLGNEAIKGRPWLFDPDSKHFLDLKAALISFYQTLQSSRGRLLGIEEDSVNLINLIEAEIVTSPQ